MLSDTIVDGTSRTIPRSPKPRAAPQMSVTLTAADVRQNAATYLDHIRPAPRYADDETPTMTPAASSGTVLLGNWPDCDRAALSEHEFDSEHSFNSLFGVFRVGHYLPPSGYPRQVFIKEYGTSDRYTGEGLDLKHGFREAAGIAGLEFLGVSVPRYALHPEEAWAAKLEIRGCSMEDAPRRVGARISKQQILDFAAANAMVGSWDVDAADVFIGLDGRLWAVDLDSSTSDMTDLGGDFGVSQPRYERHLVYTQELAEAVGLTLTREEIMAADQQLAQHLIETDAVQTLERVVEQYVPDRAELLPPQIADFASGSFDAYLDE